MAPRVPKTKEQAIHEVANKILNKYFVHAKGISINKFELETYLDRAKNNKSGSEGLYYFIEALVAMLLDDYESADANFLLAIDCLPNDDVILTNYAAYLISKSDFPRALDIIDKLITLYPNDLDYVIIHLIRIAIINLDEIYFEMVSECDVAAYIEIINVLKSDLINVNITQSEYTEVMKLLNTFTSKKIRKPFAPRFSIDNGLDRYLTIEAFLDINIDEAAQMNAEFQEVFMDYIFENDRHELLGKFLVFFKQKKNRYDGTKHPDSLYLGINDDLVA